MAINPITGQNDNPETEMKQQLQKIEGLIEKIQQHIERGEEVMYNQVTTKFWVQKIKHRLWMETKNWQEEEWISSPAEKEVGDAFGFSDSHNTNIVFSPLLKEAFTRCQEGVTFGCDVWYFTKDSARFLVELFKNVNQEKYEKGQASILAKEFNQEGVKRTRPAL